MKHTRFLVFLLTFLCTIQYVNAQKKTIHVVPENAKIFYNGQEVGNGSYEIKFKRSDDFVVLRFEAPGYITRTVRLFKENPKKTILYELYQDEAKMNSMGEDEGIDIANKYFTITCRKDMSEDVAWKRLMNIAILNFENIEIRDKAAGWLRTAWVSTTFAYQIVRTRMEIRLQFADEDMLTYQVKLSSEIADKDCGGSDQCFERYDRILRKYEGIITELQTTLGSNL